MGNIGLHKNGKQGAGDVLSLSRRRKQVHGRQVHGKRCMVKWMLEI